MELSHKAGPPLALCLAASLVSPVPHASGVIKTKHHCRNLPFSPKHPQSPWLGSRLPHPAPQPCETEPVWAQGFAGHLWSLAPSWCAMTTQRCRQVTDSHGAGDCSLASASQDGWELVSLRRSLPGPLGSSPCKVPSLNCVGENERT